MSRGFKISTYSQEEREIESSEKLSPLLSQFAKSLISQQVKLLDPPRNFKERIEWANNKMWDFSEGKIDHNEMKMVRAYLHGWMDLGSEHEKNAYNQIAKHITSLLSQPEENGPGKAAKSNNQSAVDQARARNAQSFMQQLTSLMTNKPRYATVDDAVKDMQERTGLNIHLENIKSAKKKVNKQASETTIPESLSKYDFVDNIFSYIDNNIKNNGVVGVSIPSVQHDLLSVFPKLDPSDVMNDDVAKFINDRIYSEQSQLSPENSSAGNLGKGVGLDLQENNDPWAGLMPSK